MTNKLTSISAISLVAAISLTSSCGETPKPVIRAQQAGKNDQAIKNTSPEATAAAQSIVKLAEEFAAGKVEIEQLKTEFDKFRQNNINLDLIADQNGNNFALLVLSGEKSNGCFVIVDQFLSQISKSKLNPQLEQVCELASNDADTFRELIKISNNSYSKALANVFIQKAYNQGPEVLTKTIKELRWLGLENDGKFYELVSKSNGPTFRGALSTVMLAIADQSSGAEHVENYFGKDEAAQKAHLLYISTLFAHTKSEDLDEVADWAYDNRDIPQLALAFKAEYQARDSAGKKMMREKLFEQATYRDGIGNEDAGAIAVISQGFLPHDALNESYSMLDQDEGRLVVSITKAFDSDDGALALEKAIKLALGKAEGQREEKRPFIDLSEGEKAPEISRENSDEASFARIHSPFPPSGAADAANDEANQNGEGDEEANGEEDDDDDI